MAEIRANIVQLHPFRLCAGRVEHLLLKRSPDAHFCPDIWQVITGFIEPYEQSLEAARRELLEETGLSAIEWFALPTPASFYFASTDEIILSPVFACELNCEDEPVISEEHITYEWLAMNDALVRLQFPSHLEGLRTVDVLINDQSLQRLYRLS